MNGYGRQVQEYKEKSRQNSLPRSSLAETATFFSQRPQSVHTTPIINSVNTKEAMNTTHSNNMNTIDVALPTTVMEPAISAPNYTLEKETYTGSCTIIHAIYDHDKYVYFLHYFFVSFNFGNF